MASWNKDRPLGTEAWNLGDGRIRDNFDFLEQFLKLISTFANNPADPTDKPAVKFLLGPFASRPVMSIAAQTGAVYYATDLLEIFICTNGLTNTWAEFQHFGGDVEFGGNATFDQSIIVAQPSNFFSTLGITGLLDLLGGAQLLSGKTIILPHGEASIVDDAGSPDFMVPLAHAGRHLPGLTNGAWAAHRDFLPFSIQQIRQSTTLLHGTSILTSVISGQVFGAAGVAKCSVTVDTTGRPTTSRGLIYAETVTLKASGGGSVVDDDVVQHLICRDAIANNVGAGAHRCFEADINTADEGRQTTAFLRYVTGLTAGVNHEFALHLSCVEHSGGNPPNCESVALIYIDLGTE